MSAYNRKHQLSEDIAEIWVNEWSKKSQEDQRILVHGMIQSFAKTMTIKELNEWIRFYESQGNIAESERVRLSKELDEIEWLILLKQVQNDQTKRTTT